MIPLTPALQNYAWGTAHQIPRLLGLEPTATPVAEAWFGAHGAAPSVTPAGPLDAIIAVHSAQALGEYVSQTWGTLPYLFKVLSIGAPLSIQVHPTLEQAREGFDAEEAAGIDLVSPARVFKDRSHKPEMLYALSEVRVLSGFRPVEDVAADLRSVGGPLADPLLAELERGIGAYVHAALTGRHDHMLAGLAAVGDLVSPSGAVARSALKTYPGDNGALVALAMNALTLAPGESLFTDAGVVHCYISGLAAEIMANSDNVVRAGFTSKHVDIDMLERLATLRPTEPGRPDVVREGAAETLRTSASEFELVVVRSGAAVVSPGPRIVLAVEGATRVGAAGQGIELSQGQAVFVAASEGDAQVTSDGLALVAAVPPARG